MQLFWTQMVETSSLTYGYAFYMYEEIMGHFAPFPLYMGYTMESGVVLEITSPL